MFTPDEGAETARVQRLETACHRTRPQYRPDTQRRGNPLKLLCPEVVQLEQIAEKLSRAFGDDNHIRLGDSLQARRKIWRFADDAAFERVSSSHQIADDNKPGSNPDAGFQRGARFQSRHRLYQLKSRPHCPFRIVLMGTRITEIYENPVTQKLRKEPVKASHSFDGAFMIGRHDLSQILWVHTS